MRIHASCLLVLAALCMSRAAFAQTTQPQTQSSRLVPPEPRDGEGTATSTVPILIYHAIRPYVEHDTPGVRRYIATPQTLDEELAWLKQEGYTSIGFDDLVSHITSGATLPPRPIILSFDDDWENQYRYGLPLLKKYGFTATFFIWVAVVGRTHHMTWDEIKELLAEGMQLGCHTYTHPYLTRIKKDEVLERELAGAKQDIEAHTGAKVTSLAYPFGQYNARVVAAAKAAGFTSARSTWPGVVHSEEGLFSLTGLLRTESAESLEDSLQKYMVLAQENQAVIANESVNTEPAPLHALDTDTKSVPQTFLAPLASDFWPDVGQLPLKSPPRQDSQ